MTNIIESLVVFVGGFAIGYYYASNNYRLSIEKINQKGGKTDGKK